MRTFIMLAALLAGCGPSGGSANSEAARGLIERSQIEGAFEDASNAESAAVRHIASGLVCTLPEHGAFHVAPFPEGAANEGAECTHASDGVAQTLMAVRFSRAVTIERAFAEAVAMSAPLRNLHRWRGAPVTEDESAIPDQRLARMQGDLNGETYYLRIAMKQGRDGWLLQQTVLAPIALAQTVDSEAEEMWRRAAGNASAPAR